MSDAVTADPAAPNPPHGLWQLVRYVLDLGTWGFGGPLALVGCMYRDLVEKRQWISDADYKEGLALAQLMPGPLAAQLAIYRGYVHHQVRGATLVGLAFVLPSFLMVVAFRGGLHPLRQHRLDAGSFLRCPRRGDRNHRVKNARLCQMKGAKRRAPPSGLSTSK